MNDFLSPQVPELFLNLSQRFGLLLAGGFAIMTVTSIDKLGPRRDRNLSGGRNLPTRLGITRGRCVPGN